MNILVVDDLTSVVNGIIKGIDWNALGILGVYKANNAYEAKVLLNNLPIDILLTDIEMPGESGLDLVEWVRREKLDMECIFLSSHADFEYARRAIQMGSFEYVLLPCPYEDIARSIRGAMDRLRQRREENKLYHYGKTVADDVWLEKILFRNCLEKGKNEEAGKRLLELGKISGDSRGYLCLLNIVDQDIHIEQWDEQLLEFTLENVIQELMAPMQLRVVFIQLSVTEYVFWCICPSGFLLENHIFDRQLALVRETMQSSLRMRVELSGSFCAALGELPQTYNYMCRVRNFAGASGGAGQKSGISQTAAFSGENRWLEYYGTSYVLNLEADVAHYLNEQQAAGEDTQDMRIGVHMDLVQLMYKYLDENKDSVFYIFETRELFERYIHAYMSVAELIWLAGRITDYIRRRMPAVDIPQDPVQQVEDYVREHIGQDIKRSDLAEYVHLNMDYLSRVFKREKGLTLNDYIVSEKMNVARNLLKTTRLPISLVATKVGYSNFSYFSKLYKKIFGCTPAEERE